MEPNKEVYGAELPEPQQGGAETSNFASPEIQPNPTQPPAASAQPQVAAPAPVVPTAPAPGYTNPTPMPTSFTPAIADDADLIEKEWVERAKAIVAQTAHDPNLQTIEVGKMRVDYMQKRYNKQLKLEES